MSFRTQKCVHAYVYIYIYILYLQICMYIYICMYSVYVYNVYVYNVYNVYVYIYIHVMPHVVYIQQVYSQPIVGHFIPIFHGWAQPGRPLALLGQQPLKEMGSSFLDNGDTTRFDEDYFDIFQ